MSVATEHRNAKAAEAALNNERVSRKRIDHLESFAGAIAASVEQAQQQIDATTHVVGQHMDFMQMGLWARVKWLILGTVPKRPVARELQNYSEVA